MRLFDRLVIFFVATGFLSAIFVVVGVDFLSPKLLAIETASKTSEIALADSLMVDEEEVKQVADVQAGLASKSQNFLDSSLVYIRPFDEVKRKFLSAGLPFLDVNFSNKEISLYGKEGVVSTTSILAVGDPQGWGGSPAGLYSVLDKNKLAFSNAAEAYMPEAVHIYGKYYIHGEPYLPSGEKLISATSGGCIRLADSEAGKMFDLLPGGMPVLMVDKEYDDYLYEVKQKRNMPSISADSFLVADIDSGQILLDKNSDRVLPIASITKLMTAVVVAENVDLRKTIEVKQEMVDGGFGDTEGLQVGDDYRVVELMYPLLTESSNDAALALAGFLGQDRTLSLMNKKAKDIFMSSSQFTDPSGFDIGNRSSARDLFLLGRYILNNRRPIFDLTKDKDVTTFGQIKFSLKKLGNKNEFVDATSFLGGKTGFTDESKNTGLFTFKVTDSDGNDRKIAVVLLKSEALKADTEQILSWVESVYKVRI